MFHLRSSATAVLLSLVVAGVMSAAPAYVYSNNNTDQNTVSAWLLDNGTLTELPGSPFATSGTGSVGQFGANRIAVAPGPFLFVTNDGDGSVSTFAIDAGSGALTLVGKFATGAASFVTMSLAATPDGHFLFAGGAKVLSAFSVSGTGALTLLSTIALPANLDGMKVAPSGQFLAIAFPSTDSIGMYSITGGALSAVPGSPFASSTGDSRFAAGVEFDPTSSYLFVPESGNGLARVGVFSIGATGALTAVSAATYGTGLNSNVAVMSRDGAFLFVTNQGSPQTVTVLAVDSNTGGLTAVAGSPFASGPGTPAGAAVTKSGNPYLVTANFNANVVVQSIDAQGTLTITDTKTTPCCGVENVAIFETTNAAPVVTPPADANATEGTSTAFALGSFTDDSPSPWTVTVDFGDGSASETFQASDTGDLGTRNHTYADNGAYTLTVTVADSGALSGTATSSINVVNAAPVVAGSGDQPASEGSSASFSLGSFSDVPADSPWSVVVNWGDGSANDTFAVAAAGSLGSLNHTYADNGSYAVVVTVTDKDGGAGSGSFTAAVANVAPTIVDASVGPVPAHVTEGGSVTLTGSFTDPGVLDSHVVAIVWGDGSTQTVNLAAGMLQFSASHVFVDDNPTGTPSDLVPVAFTITDKDGGSAGGSMPLAVDNAAPVVSITAPDAGSLIAVNTNVNLTASFTDAGIADTHTCSVTWDNGDTSVTTVGVVNESGGSGTCASSHVLSATGVYSITVTVTDDDTGVGTANVLGTVFEPSTGGHVTGGGWISSPAGAVVARPAVTGRANFGFVAKSDNGGLIGHTTFNVNAAQFRFESTSYDSLVVSGGKAQYRGSGRLSGSGDYGFLVTVYDGSPDRFRIKIWDKNNGNAVVYDNRMGVPDDIDNADPQAMGGGSIVIHN